VYHLLNVSQYLYTPNIILPNLMVNKLLIPIINDNIGSDKILNLTVPILPSHGAITLHGRLILIQNLMILIARETEH
jgi:hypothetical protein